MYVDDNVHKVDNFKKIELFQIGTTTSVKLVALCLWKLQALPPVGKR
jgi:hypothetical protein